MKKPILYNSPCIKEVMLKTRRICVNSIKGATTEDIEEDEKELDW